MTAIAYRDGVLAADSMAVFNEHIKELNETKAVKEQGHLIAIAGENCPRNDVFIKWYWGGRKKPLAKYKFDALVVTPDGIAKCWDQTGEWQPITGPYFAIGSGAETCMGAMHAGATAAAAVQAAIDHCPTVGGTVHSVKLGE